VYYHIHIASETLTHTLDTTVHCFLTLTILSFLPLLRLLQIPSLQFSLYQWTCSPNAKTDPGLGQWNLFISHEFMKYVTQFYDICDSQGSAAEYWSLQESDTVLGDHFPTFWNVRNYFSDDTASYPRRHEIQNIITFNLVWYTSVAYWGGCSNPPPRNSEDIGAVLDRISKKSRCLNFLL